MDNRLRLTVSCPDRVGVVAEVSQFIAQLGGWILEANHHSDHESQWFFMRYEIKADSLSLPFEQVNEKFTQLAKKFDMVWELSHSRVRSRLCLLVSKDGHCLNEVLHHWHDGELAFDIQAVISNHRDQEQLASWYEIPFHHIPSTKKSEHFCALSQLLQQLQPDLIGLARYMQILPSTICEQYRHRIINIHHGFLPSFVGAKPYHQAAAKGVKLVGATCHYVTADLDAGPIIEQDVVRINHSHQVDDLIRLGKEVEKRVFTKGLRLHSEKRILLHEDKTVVFE